jgi:purine nucleosidase
MHDPDDDEPQGRFRTAQDPTYRYRDVRMPYRSETMAVSSRELELLDQRLAADLAAGPRPRRSVPPAPATLRRIILDTDLGTDVDDALALLLLLHLPAQDLELLGVTTVYGHSHLRARVAEEILRAFARERGASAPIPVRAGESTPLGTHFPVWHTGTEGLGALASEEIARLLRRSDFDVASGLLLAPIPRYEDVEPGGRHEAARWIVEQIRKFPDEVTLVCIGALTNVAVALRIDPGIAALIPRVVLMGTGSRLRDQPRCLARFPFPEARAPIAAGAGMPWVHYPNINLIGDTLAALEVFESGVPIDVIGHEVTGQLWWGAPDAASSAACQALRDAAAPAESAVVARLLDVWLRYRSMIFGHRVNGTCPHDPLTVAEAVYPGRFVEFSEPGCLMVHEWAAFGTFACVPGGKHRMARSVGARPFLDFLSRHLAPGGSGDCA